MSESGVLHNSDALLARTRAALLAQRLTQGWRIVDGRLVPMAQVGGGPSFSSKPAPCDEATPPMNLSEILREKKIVVGGFDD